MLTPTKKGVQKMTRYRIARNQSLKAGEDIRLDKITTAERIGAEMIKILIFAAAALFLYNLIRFIF